MRKLLLAVALLLAAPPLFATQYLLENGGNSIRLYESPCVHAGTLAMIPPPLRGDFKKADVYLNGQRIYACWRHDEDGDFQVLLEDGRGAGFYRKSFREVPGV
jgi:hypothetical protein